MGNPGLRRGRLNRRNRRRRRDRGHRHVLAKPSYAWTREYIYLYEAEIAPTMGSRTVVDRPLAVVSAVNTTPVTYWVSVDHLNRPLKLTTATKASVWDAIWQPWGGVHSITGTASYDARFPGQWFQIESGLHYNWHRSYDPTLGRYTQPDPLGFVDGPSVYGYAGGSPIRSVDRDGRYQTGPTIVRPPIPFPPSLVPPTLTLPDPYVPPPNPYPNPTPGTERKYYHQVCDQPPPPNLDPCQLALWKLGRARECLRLRKKFRDDYGDADHDVQIPEREEEVRRAEEEVKYRCRPTPFACYAE
jgi:RHS repeat-associated protein